MKLNVDCLEGPLLVLVCKPDCLIAFFPLPKRLTGKSPDNLEELREMALDVDDDDEDNSEVAGQSEEEDSSFSQSDPEEAEASDNEQAGHSGPQD